MTPTERADIMTLKILCRPRKAAERNRLTGVSLEALRLSSARNTYPSKGDLSKGGTFWAAIRSSARIRLAESSMGQSSVPTGETKSVTILRPSRYDVVIGMPVPFRGLPGPAEKFQGHYIRSLCRRQSLFPAPSVSRLFFSGTGKTSCRRLPDIFVLQNCETVIRWPR